MKTNFLILSVLSILFISCLSSTTGDKTIVAEYDFRKAWENSTSSFGKLILAPDSIIIPSFKDVEYVSEERVVDRGEMIEFDQFVLEESGSITFKFYSSGEKNWRDSLDYLIVTAKGDTMAFYQDSPTSNYIFFFQTGKPYLARLGIDGLGHKKNYLKSIDGVEFDLMKQLEEFYSSVKFLQETYPDSILPYNIPN